jgi:hypothetical protein
LPLRAPPCNLFGNTKKPLSAKAERGFNINKNIQPISSAGGFTLCLTAPAVFGSYSQIGL